MGLLMNAKSVRTIDLGMLIGKQTEGVKPVECGTYYE
jgi:hypothetical protein